MDLKRKPQVLSRAYINPVKLNQFLKSIGFWRFPRRLQTSVQRLPPKLLRPPIRRPFKACCSCISYSWTTWLPWFMDSIMLRSFPRSKYYNAPALMWFVMDNGGNLCMAIPIVKQRNPCSYEQIITCKSCSYENSPYMHPQRHPW